MMSAIMVSSALNLFSHPTGNMIVVGNSILWSYINPLDDPDHHACIMICENGAKPEIFIQSDHPASDYMLSSHQDAIYIIERRFMQATQHFNIRILKATLDSEPKVIWEWFRDENRVGEGGFFMLSDDQIVFGSYPGIYHMKKGENPVNYIEFGHPVKRIRAVENNQILLMNDEACYLVRSDGKQVKQWNDLLKTDIKNAPLNRNQLFDADYSNDKLLFAYWGNRSFEMVDKNGKRKTILQQTDPLVPHWVAFFGEHMLLFSSKLIFDGSTPRPYLMQYEDQFSQRLIWGTE